MRGEFKKPTYCKKKKNDYPIIKRGTNPEMNSGQVLSLEREVMDVERGQGFVKLKREVRKRNKLWKNVAKFKLAKRK